MTAEQARQIPGTGPTIGNAAAGGGGGRGRGAAANAAAASRQRAAVPPTDPAAQAGRGGRGGRGGGGGGAPQGIGYNQVFVGSKGFLGTSGRGEGVGLLPGERWADYQLPAQVLTRSPGHQRDWIRACKGGAPSCSNFSIAGPYTEWVVLGRGRRAIPRRETAVGSEEARVHQQERSGQVRQARLSQGLGNQAVRTMTPRAGVWRGPEARGWGPAPLSLKTGTAR